MPSKLIQVILTLEQDGSQTLYTPQGELITTLPKQSPIQEEKTDGKA